MSAVVGVFRRRGTLVQPEELSSMLAAAADRGPDGTGTWHGGQAALAHQAFMINPSQPAPRMPLVDNGSGLVLSWDGRLDNADELRQRLDAAAIDPTELVLQSYRRWGTDCVRHLDGDFALVVWDQGRGEVFFARDPLGVRDLCYSIDPELFLVASEIRHLLGHPSHRDAQPNEAKVALFLANSWVDQEQSFLDGIRYCPPATCGVASSGEFRMWRYWEPEFGRRIRYRHDDEYAGHFAELFRTAVKNRLPAAGTVAVSLSGGPDSAAVAAEAAAALPADRLRSFSYVFDRYPDCDERRYIDEVVHTLGLNATYLRGDSRGPLSRPEDRIVFDGWGTQDPYVGLARSVIEAAREADCRLLLSGHYADILFAGGNYWAAELLRDGHWIRLAGLLIRHRNQLGFRRPLRQNPLAQCATPRLRSLVGWPRAKSWRNWMAEDLARRTDLVERLATTASRRDGDLAAHPRRWEHLIISAEVQGSAAARGLYNGSGVELVDPFRDLQLVEFALGIPAAQLGRPQLSKWVLRNALRGRVADPIRMRADKTSLYSLFEYSLNLGQRRLVETILESPQIVSRGWVRPEWLRQELARGADWSDWGFPLWQCLSLEMWLQKMWPGAGSRAPGAFTNAFARAR